MSKKKWMKEFIIFFPFLFDWRKEPYNSYVKKYIPEDEQWLWERF